MSDYSSPDNLFRHFKHMFNITFFSCTCGQDDDLFVLPEFVSIVLLSFSNEN